MLSGGITTRRSAWTITSEHIRRLWVASPQVVQELAEQANDLIDVFVSSAALTRHAEALGSVGDQLAVRLRELARQRRGATAPLEQRQLFEQYMHVLRALAARHPLLILLDASPNWFSESFRAALFTHTHGQPLFTVEMLRMMRERGDLALDGEGRWTVRETLAWDTLPVRVEAVIKQRVERLDDVLRQILTIASVEGEEFTTQIVARIQGIGEREALSLISQELAQRHSMVRERGEIVAGDRGTSRYQFSHALFQHYLYHRLSAGERRLLHSELARALEALYIGHTDTIAVQLAHHYTQAGEQEHAIAYLLQAGDGARTVYALKEAAAHYERALGLLKERADYAQSARTLMKLGLAYHLDFDFERSRQAYAEGFSLWQKVREAASNPDLPPVPHPFRLVWQDPPSLDPTMGGYNLTAPIIMQMFSGFEGLRTACHRRLRASRHAWPCRGSWPTIRPGTRASAAGRSWIWKT